MAHCRLRQRQVESANDPLATVTDPATGITRTLTLKDVKKRRNATEADLKRGIAPAAKPAMPDTFAADTENILKAVRALPTIAERTKHIGLWVERFGHMQRRAITSAMVRTVRDEWLTIGPKMVMVKATTDQSLALTWLLPPRYPLRKSTIVCAPCGISGPSLMASMHRIRRAKCPRRKKRIVTAGALPWDVGQRRS